MAGCRVDTLVFMTRVPPELICAEANGRARVPALALTPPELRSSGDPLPGCLSPTEDPQWLHLAWRT